MVYVDVDSELSQKKIRDQLSALMQSQGPLARINSPALAAIDVQIAEKKASLYASRPPSQQPDGLWA
eukprot:8157087-Pyramimonas_sp.AAC.1